MEGGGNGTEMEMEWMNQMRDGFDGKLPAVDGRASHRFRGGVCGEVVVERGLRLPRRAFEGAFAERQRHLASMKASQAKVENGVRASWGLDLRLMTSDRQSTEISTFSQP